MIQTDGTAFRGQLTRLARLMRPPAPVEDLVAEYWRVLEPLSLEEFTAAVTHWIDDETRFPKPADLKISARSRQRHAPSVLPLASVMERDAYLDAERTYWERPPCTCLECHAAQVDEHARRFVPREETDRVLLSANTDRTMIPGGWVHGVALARWYAARATFYETYYRICATPETRDRLTRLVTLAAKTVGRLAPPPSPPPPPTAAGNSPSRPRSASRQEMTSHD